MVWNVGRGLWGNRLESGQSTEAGSGGTVGSLREAEVESLGSGLKLI